MLKTSKDSPCRWVSAPSPVHRDVICDGCDNVIIGSRYKCGYVTSHASTDSEVLNQTHDDNQNFKAPSVHSSFPLFLCSSLLPFLPLSSHFSFPSSPSPPTSLSLHPFPPFLSLLSSPLSPPFPRSIPLSLSSATVLTMTCVSAVRRSQTPFILPTTSS